MGNNSRLTCGDGGSTGRDIIDTINSNTSKIATLETNVNNNIASISTLSTQVNNNTDIINKLIDKLIPKVSTNLIETKSLTLKDTTNPILLPTFDTVIVERGGLVADVANYALVNESAGSLVGVDVSVGLNVELDSNEAFEVFIYLNDTPLNTTGLTIKGEGSGKPVTLFWKIPLNINNGDKLDVRGRNKATGDLDIIIYNTILEVSQ